MFWPAVDIYESMLLQRIRMGKKKHETIKKRMDKDRDKGQGQGQGQGQRQGHLDRHTRIHAVVKVVGRSRCGGRIESS